MVLKGSVNFGPRGSTALGFGGHAHRAFPSSDKQNLFDNPLQQGLGVFQTGFLIPPVQVCLRHTEIGMSEAFRNETYVGPASLENRRERMSGGISRKFPDSGILGDLLCGLVALLHRLPHKHGHLHRLFTASGMLEDVLFIPSMPAVPATLHYFAHVRSHRHSDRLWIAPRPRGLRSDENDFIVDYISILEKQHIPEIDAVT